MGLNIVELRDAKTGSSAKVLTDYGFNCYQWTAVVNGEPVEMLWSAPNFESGTERASHSGIPLLFPFPGRIGGTSFRFQGREYSLLSGDGIGNAIHGFVLNRPWQVVQQTVERVTGRFRASEVDPALLEHWPADFELTVSYELAGTALLCDIVAVNPDNKPLPMGLGTHPYFRLPLGKEGTADDCRVTLPAKEYWELDNMLATGRRLPATGAKDLQQGMKFSQTKFDDVFGALETRDGRCRATIEDPAHRRRLSVAFGDEFAACVVYNPPHREAICIEPYSCVPDAFRLAEAGIEAGGVVLEPGERWNTRIEMRLEEI